MKEDTKKIKQSVHEKAIRLIEGGIVKVDGHCVRLWKNLYEVDTCNYCEMDCLCHYGYEMSEVCRECDEITQMSCWLILM